MSAQQRAPQLPESLISHVFGRFGKTAAAQAANNASARPMLCLVPSADPLVEEELDLAQRVRESGEW